MSPTPTHSASSYHYERSGPTFTHQYLMPPVLSAIEENKVKRIFELGCGNASVAAFLSERGYEVIGVDPSAEGVAIARKHHPDVYVEQGSSDDDLAARFGIFDCVLSLEVVEHVFDPYKFASCVSALLKPGGTAVISTPYHGYLKNLALSVTNKWDSHHTALWPYGHIKFWSRRTLGQLFIGSGFVEVGFHRVGRVPQLAKSMVCVYRKNTVEIMPYTSHA